MNNRRSLVLRDGEIVEECWHTVAVGDIIKMENNQFVAVSLGGGGEGGGGGGGKGRGGGEREVGEGGGEGDEGDGERVGDAYY